jgi:transposase InsO family protein
VGLSTRRLGADWPCFATCPLDRGAEARLKISIWIVDFYNTRRRHSACDGMSLINYERYTAEAAGAQAA